MDVNTFDRMVNNEFGGLGAFLTGKISFKGNILLA
jgi:putative sterol carrier protein